MVEELIQEDTLQDPPSKKRLLYDAVSKNYNLGTYDEFEKKLSDPIKRKSLYEAVGKEYNLGTYEDFESKLDVKKKELTPSTSLGGQLPVQNDVVPETEDFITKAKRAKELKNKTIEVSSGGGDAMSFSGGKTITEPDIEANKIGADLQKEIEAAGFNPTKLADDFGDMPDYVFNSFPKEALLKEYKDNPYKYDRTIGAIKGQVKMGEAIDNALVKENITPEQYEADKSGFNAAISNVNSNESTSERVRHIRSAMDYVERYGGENKEEIKKNLGADFSYVYGKMAGEQDFILGNTSKLNNLQNAALEYIKDIHPEQLKQYAPAFLSDELVKDNYEAQLGKEEAEKRLYELGINLRKSYLNEKLAPIEKEYNRLTEKAKTEGLTPEEAQRYNLVGQEGAPLVEQLQMVEADEEDVNRVYQKAAYFDANNFAQELLGQKNTGLERFLTKTGEAFANTGRGIYDFAATPFRSEQDNQLRQSEILGQGVIDENISYLKQSNQLRQSFKPELSDNIKAGIEAIKKDDTLSYNQKLNATTKLLMENSGEWQRTPNVVTNIGIKSLMYGISDLASTLAPFMLLETVTGGGATPTLARKLTASFASAAATSFEETYRSALQRGEANPYAYATRVTAINSAMMAGAGTADKVKAMFKGQKTAIGNLVSKMSTEEIEAMMKEVPKSFKTFKETVSGIKNSALKAGQTFGKNVAASTKDAAQMTAMIEGGTVINDAISGELKNPKEYIDNFLLETLKFGIFGTAMRGAKEAVKPTDVNLMALHEVASNKEGFLKTIDKQLADGDITPTEAADIKDNVETVAKIYAKNSPVFKTLDDKAQRDYLYNAVLKNKAEQMAASLPDKQAAKYEMEAAILGVKNGLIVEPKPLNQLIKRKEQLEKSLIPKKDAEGKNIEIPEAEVLEAKAEIKAIDETLAEVKEPVDEYADLREVADGINIGAYKEVFKNGSKEDIKDGLKDVSDQWHDEGSRKQTEATFPKEIIDAAKEAFPQETQKSLSIEEAPKPIEEQIKDIELERDTEVKKLEEKPVLEFERLDAGQVVKLKATERLAYRNHLKKEALLKKFIDCIWQ